MLVHTGQMSEFGPESSQGQRVRQRQQGTSDERGVALLEFTFVALILFAILFGIMTYGYMLSFRQGISQGAAEGARAAAVSPTSFTATQKEAAARNALNEALSSYDVTCSGTSLMLSGSAVGTCGVTIAACSNNASSQCVRVDVDYQYRDHPLLPTFPGLGITLPEHLNYTAVAEIG